MRRRDFVRTFVSAAAVPKLLWGQTNSAPPPPAPVPWTVGLNPSTPVPAVQVADVVAETAPKFFTATQMTTLTRLSDILLPTLGDRPGALTAGTPAFLDLLIGSSAQNRQQMYRGGLDWLNGEAKKKFSRPFSQLNAEQADVLLKPWLRTWMADNPPREAHADFINVAHSDIRAATINSKPWSDASSAQSEESTAVALYWSPIEPDMYADRSRAVKAMPKTTKSTPSTVIPRNY